MSEVAASKRMNECAPEALEEFTSIQPRMARRTDKAKVCNQKLVPVDHSRAGLTAPRRASDNSLRP
jgi:hypothetical protein